MRSDLLTSSPCWRFIFAMLLNGVTHVYSIIRHSPKCQFLISMNNLRKLLSITWKSTGSSYRGVKPLIVPTILVQDYNAGISERQFLRLFTIFFLKKIFIANSDWVENKGIIIIQLSIYSVKYSYFPIFSKWIPGTNRKSHFNKKLLPLA